LIPIDSGIDWESYSNWYRGCHNKSNSTANMMIKYASEYSTILLKSDRVKLSELRTMSKDKRRLVMASLSSLAKSTELQQANNILVTVGIFVSLYMRQP